jgi:ABC-2 type transport system permease protein
MAILYALWLRDLRRYGRSRMQIATALGPPLLYLFVLGFGLTPVYAQSGRGSYVQFVAPGVVSMTIMFASVVSGLGLLWDRQFGTLKEMLVAPVSRFHLMLGRTLGAATIGIVQGTFVLGVCLLAGFRPEHAGRLLPALAMMAVIAATFSALGIAIGSTLRDLHGFQLVSSFVLMPMFFLSGALYPLTNLPAPLAIASRLDPLAYGVDGLRGTLGGVSHFGVLSDVSILVLVALVFLAAGARAFSRIEV